MNNENNLEWYNCSIIFARALSLFLKEGESLVINNSFLNLAENPGFEPREPRGSTVFLTTITFVTI